MTHMIENLTCRTIYFKKRHVHKMFNYVHDKVLTISSVTTKKPYSTSFSMIETIS